MIDFSRIPEAVWQDIFPCPNTGCWLWAGKGEIYGRIRPSYTHLNERAAHRAVYGLLKQPAKGGGRMSLDHLCRMTLCVNPDHLEEVTREENTRRMTAAYGGRVPRKTYAELNKHINYKAA